MNMALDELFPTRRRPLVIRSFGQRRCFRTRLSIDEIGLRLMHYQSPNPMAPTMHKVDGRSVIVMFHKAGFFVSATAGTMPFGTTIQAGFEWADDGQRVYLRGTLSSTSNPRLLALAVATAIGFVLVVLVTRSFALAGIVFLGGTVLGVLSMFVQSGSRTRQPSPNEDWLLAFVRDRLDAEEVDCASGQPVGTTY